MPRTVKIAPEIDAKFYEEFVSVAKENRRSQRFLLERALEHCLHNVVPSQRMVRPEVMTAYRRLQPLRYALDLGEVHGQQRTSAAEAEVVMLRYGTTERRALPDPYSQMLNMRCSRILGTQALTRLRIRTTLRSPFIPFRKLFHLYFINSPFLRFIPYV